MGCPNCKFVSDVGDGAVNSNEPCSACGERPYGNQPSPVIDEMDASMRKMPAPGEEDHSGNPLKEGILADGGWQNRKVRDESFASVQSLNQTPYPALFHEADCDHEVDIPADQVDVLKPEDKDLEDDPDRPGKKQLKDAAMQREAILPALAIGAGVLARGVAMRAAPGLLRGALQMGGSGLISNGIGGMMGGGKKEEAAPQATPIQGPSYYAKEFESPSSQGHIPSNDTSDPEQVDYSEHNDGDKGPLQVGNDVNDMGGSDQGPSAAEERFIMLFPLVKHYNESDESGAEDPLIKGLMESFEMEHPGHLNGPDDHDAIQQLVTAISGGGEESGSEERPEVEDMDDDKGDDGDIGEEDVDDDKKTAAGLPQLEQQNSLMLPEEQSDNGHSLEENTCQQCGALTRQGVCPRCGYEHDPFDTWHVATSGGVCEQCGGLLPPYDESRHLPFCQRPDHWKAQNVQPPADYDGGEMYRKGSGQGPNTDEQKAAVAQLLMAEGRQDEIPQMLLEPWNYADELAKVQNRPDDPPEGDLNGNPPPPAQEQAPPGDTMPMPGMSADQQMMSALRHHGYSHEELHHHDPNAVDMPAADREGQEDLSQEQDSGHTWVDQSGLPLKVGQEYEMHSEKYDVPDYIRVDAVKPDSIEYTLTGEYGLEHRTEITKEEADLEGLSFAPAVDVNNDEIQPDEAGGLEGNMDDENRTAPGMEQSDVSTPHMMTASRRAGEKAIDHNDPRLDWLRVGGAKFTPVEQRDFIEEEGVARNSDKLDLTNTHYESSVEYAITDHFLF